MNTNRRVVRELADERALDGAALSRCEPLVIRKLCASWPVVQEASRSFQALAAYLARFDGGNEAQAFVAPPEVEGRYYYSDDLKGFNFRREMMSISTALERIGRNAADGEESLYVGSAPVSRHLPGFERENASRAVPSETEPRIWLGNRSHVSCHFDTFDNLACIVAGHRRFTLYSPELIGGLYVGPIDNTMAGQPVALAAASQRGDPRFPRFDAIRDQALSVELEPGDALYLPKLWWHEVVAEDEVNVLVNYWWDAFRQGPDAPFTAMMLALLAIAERPPAERSAWKAFFEHYVFRPDGHPLRHLPDDQHGVLGPIDRERYAKIRATIMKQLRQ